MSYRPKIKKDSTGNLVDLPLDCETVKGKSPIVDVVLTTTEFVDFSSFDINIKKADGTSSSIPQTSVIRNEEIITGSQLMEENIIGISFIPNENGYADKFLLFFDTSNLIKNEGDLAVGYLEITDDEDYEVNAIDLSEKINSSFIGHGSLNNIYLPKQGILVEENKIANDLYIMNVSFLWEDMSTSKITLVRRTPCNNLYFSFDPSSSVSDDTVDLKTTIVKIRY